MSRYPVELSPSGAWFVWSMTPEHTSGRSAEGLETFATYHEGYLVCAKRNLESRVEAGTADQQVPWSSSPLTYRKYYEELLDRG